MKQTLLSFFVGSMILTSVAFAQEKKVSGRVTGADGKPLVGVTIAVQGSSIATQTDLNGNYSFSVPTGKVIVCFICLCLFKYLKPIKDFG